MSLTLKRVEFGDAGVFGVLQWHGRTFCLTLEHSYRGQGNSHVPKIPPGEYECMRTHYHRGDYETWQIIGGVITPERRILIHKGNLEEHSEGCVLLGEEYGWLKERQALLSSGRAFQEFMTLTSEFDRLKLAVINC